MEATVLRFLGFLGAELLFVVASAAIVMSVGLLVMKSGVIRGRYLLINALLSTIVLMLFLTFFLWILTGEGYAWFFLGILAVSIVLMGVVELVWLVFGEHNVPWAERAIWHAHELEALYPYIYKPVQYAAIVVLLIYPVYIGYLYFGEAFGSPEWHGVVLRATLIMFIGTGYLVSLPGAIYVMVNRNIAEGTRSRIFINQLMHSVVVLMVASFFVWTLDPNAEKVPLLGKFIAFTPIVLYTTVGYVVLFLVIPYVVGHYRYKGWKSELDTVGTKLVEDLQTKIRSPLIDKAEAALVQTSNDIELHLLAQTRERSYVLAHDAASGKDVDNPVFHLAAEKSIVRDPRFVLTKYLTDLREQVDDIRTALEDAANEEDKQKLLKGFDDAIAKATPAHPPEKSGKPWLLAAITAVVVAITNPILTALGKNMASVFGIPLG